MRQTFSAILVVAALLAPFPAFALDCETTIKQTERNLVRVQKLLGKVKEGKKPRIQSFIDDAEKLLAQAAKGCREAASPFDEAVAAGKALVAQGNLGAAQLLIKTY